MSKASIKDTIKDILSGDVLKKGWFKEQYKVILLIAGLIFLYIYCDYLGQAQQHRLSNMKKELQDVQFINTTLNAQLMSSTRQSAISLSLKERGSQLKESNQAPIRIE